MDDDEVWRARLAQAAAGLGESLAQLADRMAALNVSLVGLRDLVDTWNRPAPPRAGVVPHYPRVARRVFVDPTLVLPFPGVREFAAWMRGADGYAIVAAEGGGWTRGGPVCSLPRTITWPGARVL